MDEKLKSENMQKSAVVWIFELIIIVFMLYYESNQGRQVYRERRKADHKFIQNSECTIS